MMSATLSNTNWWYQENWARAPTVQTQLPFSENPIGEGKPLQAHIVEQFVTLSNLSMEHEHSSMTIVAFLNQNSSAMEHE